MLILETTKWIEGERFESSISEKKLEKWISKLSL